PASLAKTLDEVVGGAGLAPGSTRAVNLIPPEPASSEVVGGVGPAGRGPTSTGETPGAWQIRPGPIDPRGVAGMAWASAEDGLWCGPELPACASSVGEVLDSVAARSLPGPIVFAGRPEDAREVLPRADVTLLALGFQDEGSFAETVRGYAPWLRPGSLVVDLSSTKSPPMAILERELPPQVALLGAHPLFGPTVSELTGMIVAVVPPSEARD